MKTIEEAAKEYAEKRSKKYASPILNETWTSDDSEDAFKSALNSPRSGFQLKRYYRK